MTEAEWLTCTKPDQMLIPLNGWASDRRFRLFACACLRRIWQLLEVGPKRDIILIAERYADDECPKTELVAANRSAYGNAHDYYWSDVGFHLIYGNTWEAARCADSLVTKHHRLKPKESRIAHSALIRCIFGNPFRPVTSHPSWLTPTVVSLAAGIYSDRAFDRMPILADALQDAGCEHADILAHCRGERPHVRGCWVVDLLLGKG